MSSFSDDVIRKGDFDLSSETIMGSGETLSSSCLSGSFPGISFDWVDVEKVKAVRRTDEISGICVDRANDSHIAKKQKQKAEVNLEEVQLKADQDERIRIMMEKDEDETFGIVMYGYFGWLEKKRQEEKKLLDRVKMPPPSLPLRYGAKRHS